MYNHATGDHDDEPVTLLAAIGRMRWADRVELGGMMIVVLATFLAAGVALAAMAEWWGR